MGQTAPRRQWGADRQRLPLSVVPSRPSDRSLTMGRIAIGVTVLAWLAYLISTVLRQFVNNGAQGMRFVVEAVTYSLIVSFLVWSSISYLLARQGAMSRARAHRRAPRAVLDTYFDARRPSLTVLIPSYQEQVDVIRKTVLSAALQEYPGMRIVLLVDDSPHPTSAEAAGTLRETRELADKINDLLAEPRRRFEFAKESFELGLSDEPPLRHAEMVVALLAEYRWAARWLRDLAGSERRQDHVDTFFVEQVLLELAADFALTADAIGAADRAGTKVSVERIRQLYRRLVWTFDAEVSWFERKLYAGLSHEANKAMNLNSYIGLMGRSFDVQYTDAGAVLHEKPNGELVFPDSDYLLTLDADSVLLKEYCLRLVHLLEQPQNSRLAVAQTPYSAFPGSFTRLERLAGATTDLQHIVHQGMTQYDATFWVGANAVLRKSALNDIVEVTVRADGSEIRRYIQDRTVIEDTESSIDLAIHGWGLHNYPERLSYSATPPDFGSLVIQRRRWSNGGLLILPKMWRHWRERRRRGEHTRFGEVALRVNYMASTCWASIGLVLLLAYPFQDKLLSPFAVLAALPYFLAMAGDLRRSGYKRSDIFRIYAFNLVLLPVNLAGVLKSVQQMVTGRKIPFARTPKVRNRTASPVLFALVPWLLVAFCGYSAVRDFNAAHWGNFAFDCFNGALTLYGIVAYMGIWNSVHDIVAGLIDRLYVVEPGRPVDHSLRIQGPTWREVLDQGTSRSSGVALGEDVQDPGTRRLPVS